MQIEELHTERVLSPTGITIADYVINPYRGCAMGCQYCYAKRNKSTRGRHWGHFLDIKTNAPEVLAGELEKIDCSGVQRVLIGSITEAYQNLEVDYQLTRKIMRLLNDKGIAATILTRSPLIVRDLDLWSANPKHKVCFTVSPIADEHLRKFEYQSSLRKARLKAIEQLSEAGVNVYAYLAPLLPGLEDALSIIPKLQGVQNVDVEVYNNASMDQEAIWQIYDQHFSEHCESFKHVYSSVQAYEQYWFGQKPQLEQCAQAAGLNFKFHCHPLTRFFKNTQEQYEQYR